MTLNQNKYMFRAGDRVILDATFSNYSIVDIVRIGTVFVTVRTADDPLSEEWDTMINRLSPLTEIK